MKLNIGKYKFESKEQYKLKLDSLYTTDEDGEKVPKFKFSLVPLGNVVLVEATTDEDGEILTETEYSEEYLVDAAWWGQENHPYGWKPYSIDDQIEDGQGLHFFCWHRLSIT